MKTLIDKAVYKFFLNEKKKEISLEEKLDQLTIQNAELLKRVIKLEQGVINLNSETSSIISALRSGSDLDSVKTRLIKFAAKGFKR